LNRGYFPDLRRRLQLPPDFTPAMSFSTTRPFLCLLLAAFLSPAQTLPSAALRGIVTDPSGSVVPGVTVVLSDSNSTKITAQTDAQGAYQFTGLRSGVYTVSASAPGFSPFQSPGYEVLSGRAQSLAIKLTLLSQSQQVTVSADDATKLDTDPSTNAAALVLEKTDMEALPDDPDDLTADLQALAGPAAGPDGGQFFIDGFTGGRLPPKSSIREIRVNQNPFAAEFNHPGHGRVEILTKPGTGDWHGSALFQFGNQDLNSRNPFVTTRPAYQRRIWEGDLSGPLGKNTSFTLDFERRDINENAVVNALVLNSELNIAPFIQAVVTPLTGTEGNLKIDHQLSTNHTLTVRYGYARDTNDNGGVGGFSLPERAYQSQNAEQTYQIVETAILNQRTVTETRFRYRRQTQDQNGDASKPTISVLDAFSSGGSPIGTSFQRQNRFELQNFTSYVAGKHTLRWGGLLRGVTLEDQSMQNYAGAFTFTSLASYRQTLIGIRQGLTPAEIRASGGGASQFSLTAGNPLASLNQFDYGLFVQDDWRVRPNLTLSGGLRYEAQTNASDWADIQPRFGFAWAVGPNSGASPKNVIRGGFGIFYDRLSENYTLNAERLNGIRQQQFLISNPDFYPTVPSAATLAGSVQPQTIRETDAHWRAPSIVQTAIGYERQLPKHVTVTTNYTRTAGIHQLRSRNINAPVPASGIHPYGGINAIYLYEASGIYRQNQLITNVTARVNSKFSFSGFYAYGVARSNTDGANTFPSNQYDLSTEFGRAGFDIHHRFQLNGSLQTRWGLRFNPFVTITSGRPFNITTGSDLNGDGLYLDRPAFAGNGTGANIRATRFGNLNLVPQPGETIIPRNFGQGPGLVAANLRLSKVFTLARGKLGSDQRQLILSVTARNILNHPNYGQPSGNLNSPLFDTSTTLVNGGGASGNRRVDVQVRYSF
jgi:hypothetical protein